MKYFSEEELKQATFATVNEEKEESLLILTKNNNFTDFFPSDKKQIIKLLSENNYNKISLF